MLLKSILSILAISTVSSKTITVNPGDSVQKAVDQAKAGDTVFLEDGKHFEDMKTVRSGELGNPITIKGSRKAIVHGAGTSRMFQVNHSYFVLDGFTIDGNWSGKQSSVKDYRDKCLYVHGIEKPRTVTRKGLTYQSSLDGVVVKNMKLTNAGGECSRFRYYVTMSEYTGNHVENCGVHDFKFGGAKNGEALYVGTSSNQWGDGKNPSSGPDVSQYVHIHHNVFITRGNECVDVKEGSKNVLVEHNECSEQKDPNSAGLDSRTDEVIFRYNNVFDCLGSAVRIGGHKIDGHQYGAKKNQVYGNKFSNTKASGINIQTSDGSHSLCENKCRDGCKTKGSFKFDLDGKCDGKMINTDWASGKAESSKSYTRKPESEEEEEEKKKKDSDDSPKVSGSIKQNKDSDSSDSDDKKKKVNKKDSSDSSDSDDKKDSSDSSSSDSSDSDDRRLSIEFQQDVVQECYPVRISRIEASTQQEPNIADAAIDGKSVSRWSGFGKGVWIKLDLETPSSLESIEMSFHNGDERTQKFDIVSDGIVLLENQVSSGETLNLEQFPVNTKVVSSVTIIGKGNSENDWNSITEIILCGSSEIIETDVKPIDSALSMCDSVKKLKVVEVTSTNDDGNTVSNVIDGNLKSRWSAKGPDAQSVTLKLEKTSTVTDLGLSVYGGDSRTAFFDVLVKTDMGWEEILLDGQSVKGEGIESYELGAEKVDYVQIVCYGNDDESGKHSDWNSLTEVEVYGC